MPEEGPHERRHVYHTSTTYECIPVERAAPLATIT